MPGNTKKKYLDVSKQREFLWFECFAMLLYLDN